MTQPKLITKPFADDALPSYVNEIPKENPAGAPEQNASWALGFPPITMTGINDGGLPPNGEDMNGVLRAITQHNLFIGGGGVYEFTDEYITQVGGYSKGAVLVSNDKTALWMSTQNNNTQNFNGATKTQWRRIAFTELDSTLASIQSALNTKADKSVTITAGDGLTGGGTLAGNRVIAVNNTVVRTTRTITAGTGLSGGGNLSANRTLSVNYGTTAGTAAQGNDSRINNGQAAFGWGDHASAGYVPGARTITAGTGLTGGGNLTADRTLSVNYGTTAGTAAQGNDSRIVNSVQTSGNQTIAGIKTFSSFPVTPSTAPTANYQAANKKYVDDKVAGSAIGVGQTWQDVMGSRSWETTYTNTSGSPIMIAVAAQDTGAGRLRLKLKVDAVTVSDSRGGSGAIATGTAIVPNGSSYSANEGDVNDKITVWSELR